MEPLRTTKSTVLEGAKSREVPMLLKMRMRSFRVPSIEPGAVILHDATNHFMVPLRVTDGVVTLVQGMSCKPAFLLRISQSI